MSLGLLGDLKVVEYGHYISAPYCAKYRLAALPSILKTDSLPSSPSTHNTR